MSSTNLNANAAKGPIELGQQAPKNITNDCTCNDFDLKRQIVFFTISEY